MVFAQAFISYLFLRLGRSVVTRVSIKGREGKSTGLHGNSSLRGKEGGDFRAFWTAGFWRAPVLEKHCGENPSKSPPVSDPVLLLCQRRGLGRSPVVLSRPRFLTPLGPATAVDREGSRNSGW